MLERLLELIIKISDRSRKPIRKRSIMSSYLIGNILENKRVETGRQGTGMTTYLLVTKYGRKR